MMFCYKCRLHFIDPLVNFTSYPAVCKVLTISSTFTSCNNKVMNTLCITNYYPEI